MICAFLKSKEILLQRWIHLAKEILLKWRTILQFCARIMILCLAQKKLFLIRSITNKINHTCFKSKDLGWNSFSVGVIWVLEDMPDVWQSVSLEGYLRLLHFHHCIKKGFFRVLLTQSALAVSPADQSLFLNRGHASHSLCGWNASSSAMLGIDFFASALPQHQPLQRIQALVQELGWGFLWDQSQKSLLSIATCRSG